MDVGEFPIAGDVVRAEIARVTAPAPVSGSSPLFVIVNSFDGGRGEHGPCLWEPPAGGLPAVGEPCVVVRAVEEDGEGEQTIVIAFDRNDSAATDEDVAALDARLDVIEAGREAVRYVGTGGQPAFENSWVNNDVSTRRAGFYKDRGRVYLTGMIKTGASATTAFTLPAGYRPDGPVELPVLASPNAAAFLFITAAGAVQPFNLAGAAVATFCYLEGASFIPA